MSVNLDNTCLRGLKVLDVTRFLAGPTTTQILSDMGAEVWKVERCKTGDEGRTFSPFKNGESGWYHAFNRNKKSITLNYTKPEGRELFYDLVKQCDVLVENNAPGVMAKYGLDYDTVIQYNPTIVYASISGYGQKDSPYIHYPALDGVAQAFGGVIANNGRAGQPGIKVGPGIIDEVSGYMCAVAVLGAIYEREKSGKGQYIDVCMMDAALNLTENAVTYYSFTGENMPRLGNGHASIGMTGCFCTLEGEDTFYMNTPSDKFAMLILDAIGHPELKDDPRCATNQTRHDNTEWLESLINEYTSKKPLKEIIEEFQAMGIPCMPVNTIEDCLNNPHFQQRKEVAWLEHPKIGKYAVTMTPFKMSRTPFREPTPAEDIGESNNAIYGDVLGRSPEELQELREKGII